MKKDKDENLTGLTSLGIERLHKHVLGTDVDGKI